MRTSNKILLGVLLAGMIIMIAVQVTLHVKYRNGDITKLEYYKPPFIRHELKGINCISIIGLGNVTIYTSDTSRIETERDTSNLLQFKVSNDTLVITDTSTHSDLATDNRNYQQVNIYLSELKNVIAAYGRILLKGSVDSTKAISYKLNLFDGVDLSINREDDDEAESVYFKNLDIKSNNSGLRLHQRSYINELNLQLTETNFHDKGALVGIIKMQSDSNSVITLSGNNIKKLILPQKQ